ncbi:Predicted membrane protein [Prochlorococcus marinus str. MIT 9515]|uniref:Glycerol-3-phosphate acyltransferase n=1 Tax=Prochlorococcus marinus (strain MIT 9515) TaxID=167542 RepID=PLSY_PROM5|nr:glycerol-3-phosphate 1-O-acyltransferase PlsY [Prochlorococcus marinus]A2BY34.1 RecName: Full=Glycerol-3-phosphate acyltransferase; AltName: Full=Acyl-PO4 G3P acyltransferase; AltName: Full=Acyl-phosphate--glycerol-3-phosphate acyltransferase; AltName: Full=G3P acyltransferase; Short=GPAT; AltName: Full=Lysophosphatidic acid synthase; Short=LPA synthase [Prochlorococcus marinus str. MIT 9515]ABM72695.1 Predicted membrane protein [Prochlorococcus marinus str. MIT 9515]
MTIIIIVLSYFLGSIPTGFLFGKFLKNIDLRLIGSGSTGATNVLRNVGKWPAFFVFIIDVGKGLLAVKLSQSYTNQHLFEVLAGISAVSGHIWPIWLKGKGGKAVATGLGMFIALSWKVGFASLGIFLIILSKSKIVSLSSILAAFFLPLFMFLDIGVTNHPYFLISLVVSILVILKHRTNIRRLIKGEESKINSLNK